MLWKENDRIGKVSITHRYGSTIIAVVLVRAQPLKVSITHRYGSTGTDDYVEVSIELSFNHS